MQLVRNVGRKFAARLFMHAQLVGQAAPPSPGGGTTGTPPPSSLAQLFKQFDQHYQAAIAALKKGDLTGYASEMQQADMIAQQISSREASPAPTPSP